MGYSYTSTPKDSSICQINYPYLFVLGKKKCYVHRFDSFEHNWVTYRSIDELLIVSSPSSTNSNTSTSRSAHINMCTQTSIRTLPKNVRLNIVINDCHIIQEHNEATRIEEAFLSSSNHVFNFWSKSYVSI